MRVGILASSISNANGGIFGAMLGQNKALHNLYETNIQVFGLEDALSSKDAQFWNPLVPRTFSVSGPVSFGYSPGLLSALQAAELDLLHVHGLWMYPSVASAQWSQRQHRPYLISPHGMLDPWALQNGAWKKLLASLLYEDSHLRGAACIHAVSHSEARSIRDYGLKNPICVISNGVDLTPGLARHRVDRLDGERQLLYLGRLHPKKNLHTLLHAWDEVQQQGNHDVGRWKLAIAGWDQNGYQDELKELTKKLGLNGSVDFLGPQYGVEKEVAYSTADAFILPSLSEGLPMAVLEAWSHGLPVVMTEECNLPEGFEARAGIQIGTQSRSMADGLVQLLAMSDQDRRAMGMRGKELVDAQFSWPRIANQMYSVYKWILSDGPKPDCVID